MLPLLQVLWFSLPHILMLRMTSVLLIYLALEGELLVEQVKLEFQPE
jgi:hypothetical protein